MIMFVFFLSVFMNMFMYQVHTYEKLFIAKYFRSSTGFSDSMFFGKHCNPGQQVFYQVKLVRSENDGFSCMI